MPVKAAGRGPGTARTPPAAHESRRQPDARLSIRRLGGWAAVIVPGAATLAFDGYHLGRLSLWRDEAYTVDVAHRSLPQIFALLRHIDAVNGAYYLVMHADIALFGTSEVALRLPSLLAMAAAAVITAAIGGRLARAAAVRASSVTGLLAGLLFAAVPQVTRYAQEARSYAIVTMFAALATYLLLRALADDRRRWWAGYGTAVALAGAFNLLGLLLLAAHAVTVGIARARQASARSDPGGGTAVAATVRGWHWLAAAAAAVAVLAPLMVLGFRERAQIGWLGMPKLHAITALVITVSGSRPLVPLALLLALGGVLISLMGPRQPVDVATVALPWLLLPPVILLAVSQIHPVYDERYVAFCAPALALLEALGLACLARLGERVLHRLTGRADSRRAYRALAWLPGAGLVLVMAMLLAGPQRGVRAPSSRPDNLRAAAAIVTAHERPGDAVVYLPGYRRVFGMGYPAPFHRLHDIALALSPVAASNLNGTGVSAAVFRRRLAAVARVWLVTQRSRALFPAPHTSLQRAEVTLLRRFRVAGRWFAGDVALTLLVRR